MNTKGIIWTLVVVLVIVVVGGAVWYFTSSEETNTNTVVDVNENTNTVTNTGLSSGGDAVLSTKPILVLGVEPNTGSQAGGESITVTGQNFIDGANIYFNGAAATDVVFVSETELTAVLPVGAPGGATVEVSNPDGKSGTISEAFTYQ